LVAILSNFEEFKRKVIGMFSAKLVVDELHIDNIAVDEIWRGRGVAAEMLLEGLRLGYQLGARIAELEVRSANTRARSLYEHRGFVVAGERPAYYHDPLDDALIMVSDIEQSITRAQ